MLYSQLCKIFVLLIPFLLPVSIFAENIDPNNDESQYAFGENVGWLNAEPLGEGGSGIEVDSYILSGYVWGENIGWISLSCENTISCSSFDYGIINDGFGNLSGNAWGENVGWVSFSCENTQSCNSVDYGITIDPLTGEFSGRAWGENIGWITFRSASLVSYGVTTSWDVNYDPCECDFEPTDGDVDGADFAAYLADPASISLDVFAADYGRVNCP